MGGGETPTRVEHFRARQGEGKYHLRVNPTGATPASEGYLPIDFPSTRNYDCFRFFDCGSTAGTSQFVSPPGTNNKSICLLYPTLSHGMDSIEST